MCPCFFNKDIRLAEFKYVRFQNTHLKLDERKVQEFLSTVIKSVCPGHLPQQNIDIQHQHTPSSRYAPIQKELTTSHTDATFSPTIERNDSANKTIMEWNTKGIHHWFVQHGISPEIRDLYQFKTGVQMITYAECVKDGWQKQYERYATRYAQHYSGKELLEHEFALFVGALRQLASK